MQTHRRPAQTTAMQKNTTPSKVCASCGRTMQWRSKWRNCWEAVRYCSKACQKGLSSVDKHLEDVILQLLTERSAGKTMCPSEAVRAIYGAPEAWPAEAMERCRCAARRLAAAGALEVLQKNAVVDPSHAKGPIRLRRTRT